MSTLKVLTYPHVLLKKKATPIEKFTPDLKTFSEKMFATMAASEGIGLAAPQVGISKRLIVVDVSGYAESDNDDAKAWIGTTRFTLNGTETPIPYPLALINPEISHSEEEIIFPFDGCLSLPGGSGYRTRRFRKIVLSACTVDGQNVTIETDGILSICLQHEMDHLEGILFVDRLIDGQDRENVLSEVTEYEQSSEFRKKLKKLKPVDARSIPLEFI